MQLQPPIDCGLCQRVVELAAAYDPEGVGAAKRERPLAEAKLYSVDGNRRDAQRDAEACQEHVAKWGDATAAQLIARTYDHRSGEIPGFTKKYGVKTLVYFELHDDMYEAIQREKRIKKWNRAWRIELIERANPEWRDLSDQAG